MNARAFTAVAHILLAILVSVQWDHTFNEPVMYGHKALFFVAVCLFGSGFYHLSVLLFVDDEEYDETEDYSDYTIHYSGPKRNDYRSHRFDQL